MKNTKDNKRRDFLMNVCPTVAMAFLGITVLDSCSSGDDDSDYGTGSNNNNSGNLDHSMFSTLQSNGWMNFSAQSMLLLKINSSNYRAFTNACPHQGVRDRWSYTNNQFRCSQHGNSFATDCQTAGNGGKLDCYTSTLDGSTLTVTK